MHKITGYRKRIKRYKNKVLSKREKRFEHRQNNHKKKTSVVKSIWLWMHERYGSL